MQKIITATGKEYQVEWCGVSTIDFALRFAVVNAEMTDVLTTFTNANESRQIIHYFNEKETVYNNYSKFRGVDEKPDGSIVVSLTEMSR